MKFVFLLLVLYQVKHFLCDYPLQTQFMLGKFKGGVEWVLPLLSHAAVHGFGTLAIAALFSPSMRLTAVLMTVDFLAHFIIDRIKVIKGPVDDTKKQFWWAFGLDQMAHHLTHYSIIAALYAVR